LQYPTLLRTAAWKPTVVSIGHRNTLAKFHDRVLHLAPIGRRVSVAASSAVDGPP